MANAADLPCGAAVLGAVRAGGARLGSPCTRWVAADSDPAPPAPRVFNVPAGQEAWNRVTPSGYPVDNTDTSACVDDDSAQCAIDAVSTWEALYPYLLRPHRKSHRDSHKPMRDQSGTVE